MKKLISMICVILLLASLCALTVSARDGAITIADNFNSLVYRDSVYVRVENGDAVDFDYSLVMDNHDKANPAIALTKRQAAEIRVVEATVDGYHNAYVVLDVFYKTGDSARRNVYIKESRLDEYYALLDGVGHVFTTQIDYRQDDEIVMTETQLKGEALIRDGDEIPHTNTFTVWAESEDGCFSEVVGEIMIVGPEDEYYYLDFFQNGKDGYYDLMTDLGECEDVTLYRITDEKLIERIEMDYAAFYDAQMLPYTEDVGKMLSAVMMILIFGALPFAVIVVSVIGWIRSKKRLYRRLFASMVFVGAAELAAFVTACIVCVINQ